MTELLEISLRSFWAFCGSVALFSMLIWLLVVIFQFMFKAWNRLLRTINMNNNGYPPEHCDADGDFKPEEDL